MLNFRLSILFLFLILSILCDENNILDEVKREQNYIEVYYVGCSKIKKKNLTAKDCAIATLEWDFKCCLVRVGGNNESCKYLKDDNKWIKSYKKKLEEESGEKVTIKCENSFIKFSLFLIFIFLIF